MGSVRVRCSRPAPPTHLTAAKPPTRAVNNIVINGIAFHADGHDPALRHFQPESSPDGIHLVSQTTNFTVQDCSITDYVNNITMVNFFGPISHVTILRCNISISFSSTGSHSEGTFLDGVQNIHAQGNVFDHDGWNTAGGGYATIFNHDVYVTAHFKWIGCPQQHLRRSQQPWTAGSLRRVDRKQRLPQRPHRLELRARQRLSRSRLAASPAMSTGNLFIGGRDITPALPRGTGLEIGNTYTATVTGNLFADNPTSEFPAIELGYGTDNTNPERCRRAQ